MATHSTAAVAWQSERIDLVITWDRGDEPVEWIAAGMNTFVQGLTDLLGIHGWRDAYRNPWPQDEEAQRRFVRSSPVVIEDEVRPGVRLLRLAVRTGRPRTQPDYRRRRAAVTGGSHSHARWRHHVRPRLHPDTAPRDRRRPRGPGGPGVATAAGRLDHGRRRPGVGAPRL